MIACEVGVASRTRPGGACGRKRHAHEHNSGRYRRDTVLALHGFWLNLQHSCGPRQWHSMAVFVIGRCDEDLFRMKESGAWMSEARQRLLPERENSATLFYRFCNRPQP